MINNVSQKLQNSQLSLIQGGISDLTDDQNGERYNSQNTELYSDNRTRILVCKLQPNQSSASSCHIHSVKQITVLCGYAELKLPKICIKLFEGQLFKIPNGTKHKIFNLGKIPLKYVEIRTGPYVFDDDILR